MLTTCKYFDLVGNRCSRVTCGKCDDLPDCEFKYIEELKAEIETLKKVKDFACINLNNYIADNNKLKAENDRLKEELATYGATGVCEVCSDKANKLADKYLGCLQEIKAIAEKPKLFKDFSEIKTATEVEYDYVAICNELELRLHKVLELITKAEEV